MAKLIEFLSGMLEWFLDAIQWLVLTIYEAFLEGLATVLEALPVPGWLVGSDPFASLDPGIVWWLDALQIDVGIGIIMGAYLIRFLVRRTPVVG